VVEGIMAGLHRSSLRGLSVEFSEHRAYSPGDELRRIDWKLFGRQDRYFVKEYEAETNLRAYLVVDASGSMGYRGAGGVTKLEYASYIAASLAYLMLLQRDAVGLAVVGEGGLRLVPPRSQPHHLHALIAELEAARPAGRPRLREALAEVAAAQHRRSLFVILSDFLDGTEELELGLRHVHHRKNDIMAFHVVDRDELELPFTKVTLFRDLEEPLAVTTDPREVRGLYREAIEEHLARVRAVCRRSAVDHELFPTDQPLDRALVRYLARREA
jgi:uncharacterized protein (DUF58 family)